MMYAVLGMIHAHFTFLLWLKTAPRHQLLCVRSKNFGVNYWIVIAIMIVFFAQNSQSCLVVK